MNVCMGLIHSTLLMNVTKQQDLNTTLYIIKF